MSRPSTAIEVNSPQNLPCSGRWLIISDKNLRTPKKKLSGYQRIEGAEMNREEMRKRAERRRRAIKMADEAIERVDRTLRESQRRVEPAVARLRRAGYLR